MATLNAGLINASQQSRFGEAITLPDGTEVRGIFEPLPDGNVWYGSRSFGGEKYSPPILMLDSSVADGLHEQQLIKARGDDYAISRIDRSGYADDLTRITLRPAR